MIWRYVLRTSIPNRKNKTQHLEQQLLTKILNEDKDLYTITVPENCRRIMDAMLKEDEIQTQIRSTMRPSLFTKVKHFFCETLAYKFEGFAKRRWPSDKKLSLQEKKDLLKRHGYTVLD